MPEPITPVAISAISSVSAAGAGQAALLAALRAGRSCLAPYRPREGSAPLETWVGSVADVGDAALPARHAGWDCRATRLAAMALEADGFEAAACAAIARHGAVRVGLALGTAAATLAVTEAAYRARRADPAAPAFPPALAHPRVNTMHAPAMFVAERLGIEGPSVTVSTACSSSAKVFALAERWLRAGIVDAVVVGGVDALGDALLFGFRSLGLVSAAPCRPFDRARDGISLGEAAGFALVERRADAPAAHLLLLGHGEANDAHHMSAPHPEGLGAERALDAALARAGITAADVDLVNLHGTATPHNDAVEAALAARRYPAHTSLHATKGLAGHAMGAAGMLETAVCALALAHALLPGTANTREPEGALAGRLQLAPVAAAGRRAPRIAVNHSFGFGGNNAVLVFGLGDGVGAPGLRS